MLREFIREKIRDILSGKYVRASFKNNFILSAQSQATGSVWAKLVRQGQLAPEDIIWFFQNKPQNRKWIAVFFRRSRKIFILAREWENWFKKNLPTHNGWEYIVGRPRVEDALGASLF